MAFDIHLTGHVKSVVEATLRGLVGDLVASGLTAGDSSLWGPPARVARGCHGLPAAGAADRCAA